MGVYNLVSFGGIFFLLAVGWLVSGNRRRVNWRTVAAGISLQLAFAAFVFLVPAGTRLFLAFSNLVVTVLNAAYEGAAFCFGPLAIPPGKPGHLGFILITQALPTIIFFTALMEVLYFCKIMPVVIRQFAKIFSRLLGVSGAEGLCAASNIFVGIEASATIRPYLARMTPSELLTVLTSGMGTIASSMLGIYVMLLAGNFPGIAGHLVSASILAAPATLVMAKLLLPETGRPETLGRIAEPHYDRPTDLMEAIGRGATAGGRMVMGIVVMLIAFLGLIALLNMALHPLGIKLEQILAYPFYPFALAIGIPPIDAFEAARLLGERSILNEVIAYGHLNDLLAGHLLHHPRSAVVLSYALCGFAHLASVAIFVGGTAALVPERTRDLGRLAFRALLAATLACLMTAAVAGTFYTGNSILIR